METRIKERLTGALILVALMVIVVPEFLSGHAPRSAADAVPAARPASEGPPLVTYRMPLDGTAEQVSGQAVLNVQPTQSSDRLPAPAPTVAEPPVAAAPAAPSPVVEAPPAPAAAPVPAPVPEKKAEEKKPVETKPADKKPAEKKPAEKKPAERKPAEKLAADKKGWYVQLGVFSKHENAEQMAKQAGKKGHAAQVSGSGSTWRVRVGPLADRAAAQALKKRLGAEGLAATIVAP